MRALAGCDRLKVSPALLGELEADQTPLEAALSPVFSTQHEVSLTEADFRWALASNPVANDKLAEGTRGFHTDSEKLPKLLGQLEPAAAAR